MAHAGAGQLAEIEITHKATRNMALGMSTGIVAEEDALFSSSSSGAFGKIGDNKNQYLSLAASWKIGRNINLFGSYTEMTAEPSFSGESLFSDWSRVHANSLSVGLATQPGFMEKDRLGVSIGQPMRVHRSQVNLTLPVGRDLEGNVLRERQRLDMTPSGRQTDIQIGYTSNFTQHGKLSSFAKFSLHPGHNRSASPDTALGIKWNLDF